jgi:chemotaxis protein histidine kinase CheA
MASQPTVGESPFTGPSSLAITRWSPMEEKEEPQPQGERRDTLDVPWWTDIEATNPKATNPEATDAQTEAEATASEATAPEAADAEATTPEATEAEATNSETTDAETTEAEATDAKATDAKATDTKATDTKATDTEETEAEATEAAESSSPGCFSPSNFCRHSGCFCSPGLGSLCSHSTSSRSPCSRPSGFYPPGPRPFKHLQVRETHRQPAARPKPPTFPRDQGGGRVGHGAAAGVCDGEIPANRRGQIRTDGWASHSELHLPPGRPPSALDPVPPRRTQPRPPAAACRPRPAAPSPSPSPNPATTTTTTTTTRNQGEQQRRAGPKRKTAAPQSGGRDTREGVCPVFRNGRQPQGGLREATGPERKARTASENGQSDGPRIPSTYEPWY